MKFDTICALATPLGKGAISVIRVSGDRAIEVCDIFFRGTKPLKEVKSKSAIIGKIYDKEELIDEVVVVVFKAPHTYTGEDMVEISLHCSHYIIEKVMSLLLSQLRLALAGEFTKRAFLNNKIDLIKAEAINDLINSKTKISHEIAIKQMQGTLSLKINDFMKEIIDIRSLLELEIDFLEQGLQELDKNKIIADINALKEKMQNLLKISENGIILKDGLKISLVGMPNVGKSSIFNMFLNTQRAIVTSKAGTTRDYLEEAISLDGFLVRFFDTAGIRKTNDKIEKIGIARSFEVIKNSDYILYISDKEGQDEEYNHLLDFLNEEKIIKVLNKADKYDEKQIRKFKEKGFIICSTKLSDGLNDLKKAIYDKIKINNNYDMGDLLSNARQIALVKNSALSLEKAISSLENDFGYEFTAFDLKEASSFLEEMLGKISSDDILNNIFDNFCIGK